MQLLPLSPPGRPGRRSARALACLAAGAAAFTLAACQKKELTFEERFHSANLSAAPGEKLADCMLGKLKASAAFRIGQQAAHENSHIEGLIVAPANRDKLRFGGPDVQLLLDDAGEALAVACGVDRAEWRARSPYLLLDGGENKITELGIQSMSYGIAMAGFQKRLATLPEFVRGSESVERERLRSVHHQGEVKRSRDETEAKRMSDFAVRPPAGETISEPPAATASQAQ